MATTDDIDWLALRAYLLNEARFLSPVPQATDAEDLVQETLVQIWIELYRFNPSRARVTTWGTRLLKYQWKTELDRRKRRHEILTSWPTLDGTDDGTDDA
jgi:DNA-directed RNA polymerase specialized sigma24 family protein